MLCNNPPLFCEVVIVRPFVFSLNFVSGQAHAKYYSKRSALAVKLQALPYKFTMIFINLQRSSFSIKICIIFVSEHKQFQKAIEQ